MPDTYRYKAWFNNLPSEHKSAYVSKFKHFTWKNMSETCGLWNKSCCIPGRLEDKIAIVTGSDGGLGFYITTEFARRGATVIMACIDAAEGEKTKAKMLEKYGASNPNSIQKDLACDKMKESLSPIKDEQYLNLASLASIRQFVDTFQAKHDKLHYLINNAGISSSTYKKTEDGFEMTLGVCHLGHFLLTELLLPLLKRSQPSRIIFTSSIVHYQGDLNQPELQLPEDKYRAHPAYCQSKLANTTYACELARRLAGTGVMTASIHPGMIKTNIENGMNALHQKAILTLLRPLNISPWQAIQTILYTALTQSLQSGGYYTNCTLKEAAKIAQDEKVQNWLREKSCELVGLPMAA